LEAGEKKQGAGWWEDAQIVRYQVREKGNEFALKSDIVEPRRPISFRGLGEKGACDFGDLLCRFGRDRSLP